MPKANFKPTLLSYRHLQISWLLYIFCIYFSLCVWSTSLPFAEWKTWLTVFQNEQASLYVGCRSPATRTKTAWWPRTPKTEQAMGTARTRISLEQKRAKKRFHVCVCCATGFHVCVCVVLQGFMCVCVLCYRVSWLLDTVLKLSWHNGNYDTKPTVKHFDTLDKITRFLIWSGGGITTIHPQQYDHGTHFSV